jgi:cytochrome P450
MTITSSPAADGLLLQILLTPEGRGDPYPLYDEMRELAPVARTAFGPLVVTGYDDCLAVLRDPRFGRGMAGDGDALSLLGGASVDRVKIFELSRDNMLLADPPDHTRLRKLVSRAFTPRQVDRLRPAVKALVDDLLDGLAETVRVDFMSDFALPLPMSVIGELVGVPTSDRADLQPVIRAVAKGIEPILTDEEAAEAVAAIGQLDEYFGELLAARRRQPQDDLMSGLAQAKENDDRLTDNEILSTATLLFAAGFETTTNLLGNGLLALLQHPDQMARWRQSPELAGTAVEELLRWDSPVQMNLRAALEPIEFHGETLEPGVRVIVLQGAANRDPRRFPDPNVLDLVRQNNTPLSFGWGVHHCIGAGLARMEAEIALAELLQRFSSIEHLDDQPAWRESFTLRGLLNFPISVTSN